MKAVILSAGKSTRTYPLTVNTPKPLLRILDTTVIEHNLDNLLGLVDKVYIVIGFMGEKIKEKVSLEYKGLKIGYIKQKEQLGTGHAFSLLKNIKDDFLVFNGDDLYSKSDLNSVVTEYSILTHMLKPYERFDSIDGIKQLQGISKPKRNDIYMSVNTGCYFVGEDIFKFKDNLLTNMINNYCKKQKIKVFDVKDYWIPITYWWNYLEANQFMLERKKQNQYIGEGVKILKNAYLREGTILFDNVVIGGEVIDSVIMENTVAKHNCYIGHSVIGKNCNIGAGTVTSDYRHDCLMHTTKIKNKKVNTSRTKLGTCFGENVKTGINTSIYPGRTIYPDRYTLPGQIVKEDIK